jgi:hypothetical protein
MNPAGSSIRVTFVSLRDPKVTLPSFDRRHREFCSDAGSASSRGSFAALTCVKEPARRLMELGLPLFVCMRFQDLFHSPSGVLFAFPSRYWFTIGRLRVFSLGGWSPHLQTGFHVSRPTCRKLSSTIALLRTGLSPTTAALSRAFH